MKQHLYKSMLSLTISLIVLSSFGQDYMSMYNLRTLPNANKLNPAFQTQCNGHLGGLLGPATPGVIDFTFESSSFAYSDFIYKGSGDFSDSLVWAFNTYDGGVKFVDMLDETNYLSMNWNLHLIHFGFRTNKIYWTINVSNKLLFDFSYPGDLFRWIWKGNKNVPNANLSNLGINFTDYIEYGIGASVEIDSDLRVGGKLKLLNGIANAETVKTDLHLNTGADAITLESDIQFRMSQPALELNDLYYDFEGDSLVSETTERETDEIISQLTKPFGNQGFGIDLGAEYRVMPELNVFASVIDLGFINWKQNVAEVSGGGSFLFDGFDASLYLDDNDTTTIEPDFGEDLPDSVLRVFDVRKNDVSKYRTSLPTRFYAGATYDVLDFLNVGFLYKGKLYHGKFRSSIALSGNVNIKNLSASLTYTMKKDNFDNIGIGLAAKLGPLQVFAISDHVLEEFFPHNARNINLRMGVNWIFGCSKGGGASIIN